MKKQILEKLFSKKFELKIEIKRERNKHKKTTCLIYRIDKEIEFIDELIDCEIL